MKRSTAWSPTVSWQQKTNSADPNYILSQCMIKENRQTDEALSWGFDGHIPFRKCCHLDFSFEAQACIHQLLLHNTGTLKCSHTQIKK